MANLNIDIVHEATIADLIAVRPGLAPLQKARVAPTPHRRWKQGDRIIHNLQIILIGKTGYGKSTFANTFCGQRAMKTSPVDACTRTAASYEYALARDTYVSLVDLPGVGESQERDTEYLELYRNMIEMTDVILYLMRADQRDYSIDERLFAEVFCTNAVREKTIFVLNGCDKIEPINRQGRIAPSPEQQKNIQGKISGIQSVVPYEAPVIPCSADTGWNLDLIEQTIMRQLQNTAGVTFIQ